jgi:pyruvate dehydrogenase E2 component (dihydrolipoamide acetyltransferase)
VKENDVIAEVENGKATVDFTSTDEGYLAKILVPAGTKKVKVGTVHNIFNIK